MGSFFNHGLITNLILFQLLILVVVLSNLRLLHRARRHAHYGPAPLVSILVPARNEEKNIRRCLQSLLAQNYPAFEILALDDQSTDGTPAILQQLAEADSRLKVFTGSRPPEGLSGKNWACSQLALQASGDLLLFTDADTVHQPHGLSELVAAIIGERADLLSGFPFQEAHTWGERLLVPFFSWAVLNFIPLWLAYRLPLPALSIAIGQVILIRKEAYQAVGGHLALGTSVVEDLTLARKIQAAGLRGRMVHLSDLVRCRMYPSGRAAWEGFSRNLFAAFDFRLLGYLFVYLWLAVQFWAPWVGLAGSLLGQAPVAPAGELIACIGLALLLWIVPYRELGLPISLACLYPITILANDLVAFRSLYLSLTGRLIWKDRRLPRPKWKWL